MANAMLRYQDVWLLSDRLRGVAIVEIKDENMIYDQIRIDYPLLLSLVQCVK
jgi:hypothetical protein